MIRAEVKVLQPGKVTKLRRNWSCKQALNGLRYLYWLNVPMKLRSKWLRCCNWSKTGRIVLSKPSLDQWVGHWWKNKLNYMGCSVAAVDYTPFTTIPFRIFWSPGKRNTRFIHQVLFESEKRFPLLINAPYYVVRICNSQTKLDVEETFRLIQFWSHHCCCHNFVIEIPDY